MTGVDQGPYGPPPGSGMPPGPGPQAHYGPAPGYGSQPGYGPPGYGQTPGYGPPFPGGPHGPVHPGPGWRPQPPQPSLPAGMAITSLVLGICGLTIAWLPFLVGLGLLLALAAIVLGGIAHRRARQGTAGGRGMALAGLVTGVAGVLLSVLGIFLTVLIVRDASAEPWVADVPEWESDWDGGPGYPMDDWERRQLDDAVPFDVGERAQLGDAAWTVTGIAPDVPVDLSDHSFLFPEGTSPDDYQLVVVDLVVQNTGTAAADPADGIDLRLVDGADRVHYDTCSTQWPGAGSTLPTVDTLQPGERAEAHVCFVVPGSDVAGSRLVGTPFTVDAPTAVWRLDRP